jgi:cyclopropane-fatty-acyl-phospholipid synthase
MLLSRMLKHVVRVGTLEVIDANGRYHKFSGTPGPEVTIRLHDRALHTKLYFNPDLYVGEAWMDGTLTIEKGTLPEFVNLLAANMQFASENRLYAIKERLSKLARRWQQYNPVSASRRHVSHHYDLPDWLYDIFLDRNQQYSCAYFQSPQDNLETAQLNKQNHLAAKLLLEPQHKVLDIGSGWGGLALHLAEAGGAEVTGLTLSQEQLKVARKHAKQNQLADKVHFHLRDYREEAGTYDRIVSVGMFEHVGVNYYPEFFSSVKNLLTDDGVCVIHSIGRMNGPSTTSAWIRKYIFPGGYSPALSETISAIESSGLWVTDVEVLRLHYAQTLKAWRQRFVARRDLVVERLGERFYRMWEFYLAASEAVFRHGDHYVFQIQIAKRRDAVPLTRDYITEWEASRTAGLIPFSPTRAA